MEQGATILQRIERLESEIKLLVGQFVGDRSGEALTSRIAQLEERVTQVNADLAKALVKVSDRVESIAKTVGVSP